MINSFDETLRAAKVGEGWAFDSLFEAWNRPLTGFVAGRGVSDSDDVVNEIFLGAFRSIQSFNGEEADFRAWLFRIARNKIADSFRQRGRHPVTVPLEPGHPGSTIRSGDVEADADARLGSERVHDLLGRLTDEQREVMLLRIVADCTIDQIADITGRRRGAVKQLQRRALRQLEKFLSESHTPPSPTSDS